MILWLVLLMFFRSLNGSTAERTELERIDNCGTHCSQGLHCRTKPDYWFSPECQNPAKDLNNSSVFHNVGISTVMTCEKKQKCKLHLKVQTVLQLTESIHGVSLCTVSAGMMTNCQNLMFTKASRKKLSGLPVTVENDCTEVSPNQQLQVMVKTVPSYCGISWAGTYHTLKCIHEDLRMNVPECITGRLSYTIDSEKKELQINVTDMLEDYNYHLRLCHKDFICIGTGEHVLIQKEQAVKSATLRYSQPLPCLCIEGWSAVMDASRVQVCPFKDRLEELWFGITFDPVAETLIWEPACLITAVVGLCEKRQDGMCVDLPHSSQNVRREKVAFPKVDPHPQLCVKFSVGFQSWIRCPFADMIKAWDVVMTSGQGREEVQIQSRVTGTFSVGLCVKSAESSRCKTTKTRTMHVEKQKPVDLELPDVQCSFCIQVKRLNVTYSPTVIHCFEQCMSRSSAPASLDLTWVILPAAICLSGIIIITLVLYILFTVYQRRKQKRRGACVLAKQTGSAHDSVDSVLQPQLTLTGRVLVPDSPQCGNKEKTTLIS